MSPDSRGTGSFHGPRIVALATLGNVLGVGGTLGVYGVFIGVVAADLELSRAQAGLGNSIFQLVTGLGSPFVGWLLARHAPRPLLLTGALLLGLGLLALSQATVPWQAAVVMVGVGLGSLGVGPLPGSTLVANWYVLRRGRALGVALAGTTLGTAVLPPVVAWAIGARGWRFAMAGLGALALACLLPAIWRWAIAGPELVGQRPDGVRVDDGGPVSPHDASPVASSVFLRDARFWLLVLIFGGIFGPGQALLVFFVPFAESLGMSLQVGASLMAGRAVFGVLGKLAVGSLADRVDHRWLLAILVACQIVAWIGLINAPDNNVFAVVAVVQGTFGAGITPLQGAMFGAVFGRRRFAQAYGLASGVKLPVNLMAAPVFGWLVDFAGGDFTFAFQCYLVSYVFVLALLPLLRIPDEEPDD